MNYRITSPLIRESVLLRDSYRCQCCDAHPGSESACPEETGLVVFTDADMTVEARCDLPTTNQSDLITMCPDCSVGRFESEGRVAGEVAP